MRITRILAASPLVVLVAAACSPDNVVTGSGSAPIAQRHEIASSRSLGPNGFSGRHYGVIYGWMGPDAKTQRKLLYVSNEGYGVIDVFSVPSYKLVGQIANGINQAEGLATDKQGNLYVSNLGSNTVTVYARGSTTPKLTLTDPKGPDDVAVTKDGYVLAGDVDGGVDVYAPGQTKPEKRLRNSDIRSVYGVGADSHNNAYASGSDPSGSPVVIAYANLSGSGTNLQFTGLVLASGVLADKSSNVVVTDYELPGVNIYPPGHAAPSATIANSESPDRSALNGEENLIYVPEGLHDVVNIYDYPSGKFVKGITIMDALCGYDNFVSATAFSPAPKP
jgi:hypothetical protein